MISVIVPTYNSEKTIAACLKSIKSQQHLMEIIVVDNFSTDDTVKIAKKLTKLVFKVDSLTPGVQHDKRSSQRNFGAQKAHGDYLFFVDSDQTLSPNCLKNATDTASKNNLDAIIIPEQVKGDNFWSMCLNLEKQIYTNDQTVSAPRLIKKSAFLKVGGFDEKLIAGEDWDLHLRLIDKDAKIGISKSPIYNLEQNSTLSSILKKKFYYAKNIKNYAKKHPKAFIDQTNFISRLTNSSALSKMAKDPMHATGLIFLKIAQFAAAIAAQF